MTAFRVANSSDDDRPERRFACGAGVLVICRADITTIVTDVVVNAANPRMMGGGGVDGAIHRRGGPSIMAELRAIMQARTHVAPGDAVVTSGGLLPAKWVVHAVGPVWRGGHEGERETLLSAVQRSLELAKRLQARSVAFPALSTGAYGFPMDPALAILIGAFVDELRTGGGSVERISLCLLARDDVECAASHAHAMGAARS